MAESGSPNSSRLSVIFAAAKSVSLWLINTSAVRLSVEPTQTVAAAGRTQHLQSFFCFSRRVVAAGFRLPAIRQPFSPTTSLPSPAPTPVCLCHRRSTHRLTYRSSKRNVSAGCMHTVKWRHRVCGHDTIAILWVKHDVMRWLEWRRFIMLFK